MRTWASAPRRRTGWSGGSRRKKDFWSGFRRAPQWWRRSTSHGVLERASSSLYFRTARKSICPNPSGRRMSLNRSGPLSLSAGVAEAIRRHGEETYPHECCGALIGAEGRITAAVALPNTTEEGPRRRFLVRPSDYRMAEKSAGEHGAGLLGFYH